MTIYSCNAVKLCFMYESVQQRAKIFSMLGDRGVHNLYVQHLARFDGTGYEISFAEILSQWPVSNLFKNVISFAK